jgi:hypothetical protein
MLWINSPWSFLWRCLKIDECHAPSCGLMDCFDHAGKKSRHADTPLQV